MPDSLNDDLDTIELSSTKPGAGSAAKAFNVQAGQPHRLLAEIQNETDRETREFMTSYLDYSKVLGLALWSFTNELKLTYGRVYDHLSTRTGSQEDYESFTSSPSGRLVYFGASILVHHREMMEKQQAGFGR